MKPGLLLLRVKNLKKYTSSRYFRFAVVNLDIHKRYPVNYVCMLPMHLDAVKKLSAFDRIFGDKGVEVARMLLNETLKVEQDAEARKEIEKRLQLLMPKLLNARALIP